MPALSPSARLARMIAEYPPEIAALGTAVLRRLRRILPPAHEMVYDNYNFLVVGFSPSERPSAAVLSLVFAPHRISVCFLFGRRVPDPNRLLSGGGKRVRFLRLPDPTLLDDPRVRALLARALESGPVRFGRRSRRTLVIRSVSARRRPRRPATKPETSR